MSDKMSNNMTVWIRAYLAYTLKDGKDVPKVSNMKYWKGELHISKMTNTFYSTETTSLAECAFFCCALGTPSVKYSRVIWWQTATDQSTIKNAIL
jgi:hypothetical protein